MDIDQPIVQSLVIPFLSSLVISLLIALSLGRRAAAAGIGIGLMCSLWVTLGPPVWPPSGSVQKLPWIIAALTLIAVGAGFLNGVRSRTALDPIGRDANGANSTPHPEASPRLARLLAGGAGAGLIAWWLAGLTTTALVAVPIAFLILAALLQAPVDGANRTTMLLVGALALAGACVNASSLSLAQIAGAAAAAVGGFAVLSWPVARLPATDTAILCIGLALFGLALTLTVSTEARPWALTLIAGIFAANLVARTIPLPRRLPRRAGEPILILLLALAPAAAAVMLTAPVANADSMSSDDDDYR